MAFHDNASCCLVWTSENNNQESPCPHLLTFILSEVRVGSYGNHLEPLLNYVCPGGPSTRTASDTLSPYALLRERLKLVVLGLVGWGRQGKAVNNISQESHGEVHLRVGGRRKLLQLVPVFPDPEVRLPVALLRDVIGGSKCWYIDGVPIRTRTSLPPNLTLPDSFLLHGLLLSCSRAISPTRWPTSLRAVSVIFISPLHPPPRPLRPAPKSLLL